MMLSSELDPDMIEAVMDAIEQPIFLLDVDGPGQFRIRRLNNCHKSTTGLSDDQLAGQRPHDVFPPRLADTIVQNYEICRASGESYDYDENLELPSGPRWWRTSLSPIKNPQGDIVLIVGLAVDITGQKRRQFSVEDRLTQMSRLNSELQVFAASTAQNMRGPFQTMAALLDLVREDFVDFGDEKVEQLELCSDLAHRAIQSMAGVIAAVEELEVGETPHEQVDLFHVTSDIAAIIDPHQRVHLDVPREKVATDSAALQMVLRRVMENAVHYADSRISVAVTAQGGRISVSVADDGASPETGMRCDGLSVLPAHGEAARNGDLNSARSIVEARGGTMTAAANGDGGGAVISFTLSGSISDKAANGPKPALFQDGNWSVGGTSQLEHDLRVS